MDKVRSRHCTEANVGKRVRNGGVQKRIKTEKEKTADLNQSRLYLDPQ